MRVTKKTNIAIRVMMFCAANENRQVTKSEIAEACNVSENHLARVVNSLAHEKFIKTQRGRHGGIRLARAPKEIVIGEIFRALEAPVPIAECFADGSDSCPLVSACRLRLALTDAAEAFFSHLDTVTLDALVCNNDLLMQLLRVETCRA